MPTFSNIIAASTLYTTVVFAGGFLCGTIRVPLLQPLLGDRHAQLLEMPVMFLLMWHSATMVVDRLRRGSTGKERVSVGVNDGRAAYILLGLLALAEMLAIEAAFYMWMNRHRQAGLGEWIWDRDPVAGTAYFAMLAIFAVLPALLA